jgi:Ser/Thr protein kinase RdoA (MazF antagonist)
VERDLDLQAGAGEAGPEAGEMLEQSAIAHYLLSLGLVKPRAVLEEGLTVTDVSRRNSVFLATTGAGPTYVVKQATPRGAATLAHEAAVLRALAGTPDLAPLVPTVVHYEPEEARLVMRTPAGARDWSDHHGSGRFPRIPGRFLGRALAALHRLPADRVAEQPPDLDPMWGLSLAEPSQELLLGLSAGGRDLVARVQAGEALCDRLDELRGAHADATFVHGDLRWDNCLAVAAPGSRRRTRVLLVDWELAGRGPAEFDVGTVFAEYLRSWVGSIPIVDPRDPGRLLARAGHPLRRMQPAMHAFWSAYRHAGGEGWRLGRVVELAAVRLLQSAVERTQGLVTPTAHVVTLVQVADNMLRDPDDAAARLLGLGE